MEAAEEIHLREQLLLRRAELVKLKSIGSQLHDIVKSLAVKYGVSERQIYHDWKQRKKWLPTLLSIEDPHSFFLDIISKHDELRKLAVLEFLKAPPGSTARIGALRLIRDIDMDLYEIAPLREVLLKVEKLEERVP